MHFLDSKYRLGGTALLSIAGLISLAIIFPPDGHERSDFAQFFGNFHTIAVHFPLGLLLVVPLLEIAAHNSRRRGLRPAAGFVLGLAMLGAIATPYLGWLLAWSGGFAGTYVTQHMWGGISVATFTVLCWFLRSRASSRADRGSWAAYAASLTFAVLLAVFTGYRGGQLAHGENHMTEHLPASFRARFGIGEQRSVPREGAPSSFYAAHIAPIFEKHCLVCHGAKRQQGGLRLDSYAALMRGGKDGAVIRPGQAEASELYRRVNLSSADEKFMPAEGKPPLGEGDRKALALWINAGASPTGLENAIGKMPAIGGSAEPLVPDYRVVEQTIPVLETSLNVRIVARSQNPTDGLILRTASFPAACSDETLAKLRPVDRYIVDAELARTGITDAGLRSIARFRNLRLLDLSHTAVTSAGLLALTRLSELEVLNLTGTRVDAVGLAPLRGMASLKRVYISTRGAL